MSVADYGRTRRIEERTGVAGVDRNRVFGRSELFSLRDAVLFRGPGADGDVDHAVVGIADLEVHPRRLGAAHVGQHSLVVFEPAVQSRRTGFERLSEADDTVREISDSVEYACKEIAGGQFVNADQTCELRRKLCGIDARCAGTHVRRLVGRSSVADAGAFVA